MLHAHFTNESADCDGRYTSTHVVPMTAEEQTDEFGDVDFHARIVGQVVSTYGIMANGTLEVDRTGVGTHDIRLTWSEPTDEGFRCSVVELCLDEACDLLDTLRRDHSAEAAGY